MGQHGVGWTFLRLRPRGRGSGCVCRPAGGAFPDAGRGPMPFFAPNRLTPLGFCPVREKWELPSDALAVPAQHPVDRVCDREMGRIEKKRVGIML